jgi:hypothetical protein
MARKSLLSRSIRSDRITVEQDIREWRFQQSLALISAISSLLSGLEVTYEHYRSGYGQQVMYTPVLLSLTLSIAGVWAFFSRWAARVILPVVSLLTLVDGVVGFYFHVRGVARKPGGWRIPVVNVVMGPPVLAPLLFGLSGYLGLVASFLRRESGGGWQPPWPSWITRLPRSISKEGINWEQHVREGRFQRQVAAVAALSALFSGFEALYSHYKDDFRQEKLQWSPILLSLSMLVVGTGAVWSRLVARRVLPVVSVLAVVDGSIGAFFHVRGVIRRCGGIHKPLYNVIYGPPVFAPLLFAASGFLGVLASQLRRADR